MSPWVTALTAIVALALAVSAVSVTVTKTKIFQPVRRWTKKRSPWAGALLSCPYCLSHWLAFVAVPIYRPQLVSSGFLPLDLLVSVMVIVALAAFFSGLILRAFMEPAASDREEQRQ